MTTGNRIISECIIFILAFFTMTDAASQVSITKLSGHIPRVISFNSENSDYQEIMDGPDDGTVFYSGFVTIEPGKAGELHSTEIYEEMIIVLYGKGIIQITGSDGLEIQPDSIAYIPVETEHRVFNHGTENLKYIYIATKSK